MCGFRSLFCIFPETGAIILFVWNYYNDIRQELAWF